jgi:hypothetical protein
VRAVESVLIREKQSESKVLGCTYIYSKTSKQIKAINQINDDTCNHDAVLLVMYIFGISINTNEE